MKKIIIILLVFFLDRISKIYLLNLEVSGTEIDFYINSFLNFYLVWNSGIGFGLVPMEANIYYHAFTTIIVFINVGLIYFLIKYLRKDNVNIFHINFYKHIFSALKYLLKYNV